MSPRIDETNNYEREEDWGAQPHFEIAHAEPPSDRIVRLREEEGLSFGKIAEMLGLHKKY